MLPTSRNQQDSTRTRSRACANHKRNTCFGRVFDDSGDEVVAAKLAGVKAALDSVRAAAPPSPVPAAAAPEAAKKKPAAKRRQIIDDSDDD